MSTVPAPRSEHPRPQFCRDDWLCLNGRWTCRIDPLGEESDAKDSDWGYGEAPKSAAEFEARLHGLMDTLLSLSFVRGHCYTRLTDVEQERTGLLTFERHPKLPIETYRTIFGRDPA